MHVEGTRRRRKKNSLARQDHLTERGRIRERALDRANSERGRAERGGRERQL